MADYYTALTPQSPKTLTPLEQLPEATRRNLDNG